IKNIRARLPKGTMFCAVVKADGYGHGSVMVTKAAIGAGAEWIGVAMPEEAVVLRNEGVKAPILVLGPSNLAQWRKAADYDISMVAASLNCIKNALKISQERGVKMKLHLKIDTGMNRVGIKTAEEAKKILDIIEKEDKLVLEGLMTHFASADEADKSRTIAQNKRFADFIALVCGRGFSPIIHAGNSGAALDCPEMSYNMVRVGIALYGYYPSNEVKTDVALEPAMALHTQISFIKDVEAGESLSYGGTFTAPKPMRIATLPIGYADGFSRLLSDTGEVLILGQRARVVGRVCMDQILVDITDIKGVKLQDNVVCFGRQNGTGIPVEEYARRCGTINYEILCAVSPRVPRLYYED
ncbi:MAG: alanine racemase, partial [Christensenellales bacterium]